MEYLFFLLFFSFLSVIVFYTSNLILKNYFFIFGLFIYIIFVGFRFGVGTDYYNYMLAFNDVNSALAHQEFIFKSCIEFLNFIGLDSVYFFVIFTLLIILFAFCFFRKFSKKTFHFSCFIFLISYFTSVFGGFRLVIAVLLSVVSVYYFINSKYFLSLVFLVLTLGFHRSGIFLLLIFSQIYFFNKFGIRNSFLLLVPQVFILSSSLDLILQLAPDNSIFSHYMYKLNKYNEYSRSDMSLSYISVLLKKIFFICFFYVFRKKIYGNFEFTLLFLIFFGYALQIFSPLSSFGYIFLRGSSFFVIYEFIIISLILYRIGSAYTKFILVNIVILIHFLSPLLNILLRSNLYFPYKSILL